MDIEGTYTLQAPLEEVWQCLMDMQALRHAIPGMERLEPAGQDSYTYTLRVKQAPLRGVYTGRATIDDVRYPGPPAAYHLTLEGDGQHNPFQGIWDIRLSQQHDNTVVAYSGALNPGKMSALLPPVLVKGAVKILVQQFFTNLAEQLRTTPDPPYLVPDLDASETHPYRVGAGLVPALATNHAVPARTFMHRLVRLVGLGNHDAALEEQWVARLKRFGAFSVLLLLVWIGTRLPRRLLPRD